ncbi:hypothetical protein SASPL_114986 [Salvia splendens]|uniref:RNase H type-1 domain-containing protein n=1 Tax=Salvia splendens TaxID=180675 RepID=A0A8X8Y2D1_SALSN|nr:hypothetical protein SASPL_114986 [Salvia splendens]
MCNPGVRLPHRKIKEFWRNGEWNHPLVRSILEPLGVPMGVAADIVKVPIVSSGKDTLRWIPPNTGWLKLNVDGVWSNGEAGAGGTLRDDGGNLICGFKAKVVASSRMDATLQAVSIGLNMAMERGQQIWLEIGE